MRFTILYSDVPWSFKTYSNKGRKKSADQHYPCMSLDDIQSLPVADISNDDSILLFWTISTMLPQALDIIKAWGFTYKTLGFVFAKKNKKSDTPFFGLGYWTRQNVELCLLATRGHPKRIGKNVEQLLYTPIEEHSKKPDEFRNRIVRLMGDVPRVEIFARKSSPGWTCIGNEITGNDIRVDLERLANETGGDIP